jgi:hypothetical protein
MNRLPRILPADIQRDPKGIVAAHLEHPGVRQYRHAGLSQRRGDEFSREK